MRRLHVEDGSPTNYPEYCGVLKKDGKLFVALLDAKDWESAEVEFVREVATDPGAECMAVVLFTHAAYAQPGHAKQHCIDMILETAAAALNVPYAKN